MKSGIVLAERGLVPESLERWGIRRLLRRRLEQTVQKMDSGREESIQLWADVMRNSPVALVPEAANEQHYEVPADFYAQVLGPHRKYSSAYFPPGVTDLAEAEASMLALTCERAKLAEGQRILELGCGWGSLTLWMAENYRTAKITAVSNSNSQRQWILEQARARGIENVQVITCDMNEFQASGRYDRVVSVEMFEHMRNWEKLLGRVRGWIEEEGRVFLHVFAHQKLCYPFEVAGANDWMAEHFFTGGMMPSHDLLRFLDIPFEVEHDWVVNGTHYEKTSEAWLQNLENRRDEIWPILERTYGVDQASRWFHRWRLFFISCAELFGFDAGEEWIVSHFLLKPVCEA